MPLIKRKPKTSQQKAQKAQMGILARILGCGYLLYVVYQLLQASPEEDSINPTLKTVVIVVFLIAAAVIITITLREFIQNLKSGYYKAASYKDDEVGEDAGEFGIRNSEFGDEDGDEVEGEDE